MIKQRRESIAQFEKAAAQRPRRRREGRGRRCCRPTCRRRWATPRSRSEIDAAIAETGASGVKDMGKVMARAQAASSPAGPTWARSRRWSRPSLPADKSGENPGGVIPDSFKQDLLNRVDIVDVVARYVQLKKGGANYRASARSTARRRPSFTVSPAKQFYHCFGCGAHGNAIGFLMEYAGARLSRRSRSSPPRSACRCPRCGRRTPRGSGAQGARDRPLRADGEGDGLLPRRAEEIAARHRLPQGPRPDRRDRRALPHRLRARRLAGPEGAVPAVRGQGAGRVRAW